MSGSATVTIRLDGDLKRKASEVAGHYGLDLSTATRLFYTQMVNTNTVPVSLDYERPNAESREAIRDARAIMSRGGTHAYSSAEDMISDLGL